MNTFSRFFSILFLFGFISSTALADNQPAPSNQQSTQGHPAEHPEPAHTQSAGDKILWGLILGCISVVLFSVGGDIHTSIKTRIKRNPKPWGWRGQWIGKNRFASLLILPLQNENAYLTVDEQAFTLIPEGHDTKGNSWGELKCSSGAHTIGKFELQPNKQNMNLPRLKLAFENGQETLIIFARGI